MNAGLLRDKAIQKRLLQLLLILLAASLVRGLTAQFIGARLADPGWFPYGIYAVFDHTAQDALDGRAGFFRIDDPSQTDAAIYPPGYPIWLATIYKLTGERSPAVVQKVQWVIDALSVLLIVGIGVTAFGWRVGLAAGWLMALWPLPAFYGATPLADSPTSWVVLGGAWLLVLAGKRKSIGFALGAGVLLGLSCWLRANAMVMVIFWAAAVWLFTVTTMRRRLILSGAVVLAGLLVMAPVVVRNVRTFHAFLPTGLGIGTNLWEGIGEDQRGRDEFGAVYGDDILLAHERAQLNPAPGEKFNLYYPNGVERDRERTRRSVAVIKAHPVWYTGVVLRRMAGVLKYAGEPSPIFGSSGFNVTGKKCLPENRQGGVLGFLVNVLGAMQSVLRYLLLPMMIVGVVLALHRDWRMTGILMATILYYLVVGSMLHTHIRYGLPMQALLTIFAATSAVAVVDRFRRKRRDSESDNEQHLSTNQHQ